MYSGKIPKVFLKLRQHRSRWCFPNTRIQGISESRIRCFNCSRRTELFDPSHRNGHPRRKQIETMAASSTVRTRNTSLIETFFENVDFSDSSAVNKFITNKLQLDEANRNAVYKAVDSLCRYLQHYLPSFSINKSAFSINKFVKGGSFGKGTAVKDKADIDCVVFLNNVKTVEEHKLNLPTTKDRLELCLKQSRYKDQITFEEQTPFAVKFKFRLESMSQKFDVDLLPTFSTDQSLEELYKEMIGCTPEDRRYYSAHFVELQVEFVKGQPSIVKDLIRLVKYWRKTCIEDTGKTRLPSSYPLELITIHCWEKAGKPESFDIRAGFKVVLQQLVEYCDINVRWYINYDKDPHKGRIKRMSKSRPFMLDPANPTNNVCSASDPEGWKIVADVADMTLKRKPLADITVTKKWKI
ncbi:2'-5'-oligoadenylate synthase 1-like [Acropora muricata]|uniref:2'-5'-oligoadenylate synthase 1-like n=1 Tax=Acropora muricata TaxID=159855 RepID=UPI0034E50E16